MDETIPRFSLSFADVKEQASLREFAEQNLEHVQYQPNRLVCPLCGSGNGPKHTPAFSIAPDEKMWKCFSCGASGDVFDLAGAVFQTDDKREQLKIVAQFTDARVDEAPCRVEKSSKSPALEIDSANDFDDARKAEHEKICEAQNSLNDESIAYLKGRGFTEEEIHRFGFGFNPKTRRIVIPWSTRNDEYYHIDRAVDDEVSPKYLKPPAREVGSQPVHDELAFEQKSFFAVEGLFDAFAIMACGYPAVALGSVDDRAFIEKAKTYKGCIILALDCDDAGRAGAERVASKLSDVDIQFASNLPGAKDACELLAGNRSALENWCASNMAAAEAGVLERKEERLRSLSCINPADAAAEIYMLEDADDPIPTGIRVLDNALGGGLKRGLIMLGAVSSVGKTTFLNMIADNLAENGKPVLFVTIEQSSRELTAKSLSRRMYLMDHELGNVSYSELYTKSERMCWSDKRNALFAEVTNWFTECVAPHERHLQARDQPSVADIAETAYAMEDRFGTKPIVIIDYLQLLAPMSERDSDKQAVDKNVMALRQLSRDMKTTIICVSSLNRSSYAGAISFDSFKESGAIEYGADILLGLQPREMAESLEGISDGKQKAEAAKIMANMKSAFRRECEIVILKQRAGVVPAKGLPIDFLPRFSLFEEPSSDGRVVSENSAVSTGVII